MVKSLVMNGDKKLISQHVGLTDDEVYIPLIVIDRTNNIKNK